MFVVFLFLLSIRQSAAAQSEVPKFEVGGQVSFLRIDYKDFPFRFFDGSPVGVKTWTGGGGRVTYNVNKNFAVEGVIEGFPLEDKSLTQLTIPQPRVQGFFGVKTGVHRDKYGVFFKVRPGFIRYSPTLSCSSLQACEETKVTKFALDVGGVVEGYVAKHFMVRGDFGGTYLRYPPTAKFFPGEPATPPLAFIRNGFRGFNLQISAGVGYRF